MLDKCTKVLKTAIVDEMFSTRCHPYAGVNDIPSVVFCLQPRERLLKTACPMKNIQTPDAEDTSKFLQIRLIRKYCIGDTETRVLV